MKSLWELLSTDERARAERFAFQKDRKYFTAARGLLRVILGSYLDINPGQVRFCYGPYGKPALAKNSGDNTLCFNLSHSQGVTLYAISRGRELGIDIEHLRPDLADMQIAERFFSPREITELSALSPMVQAEAFFNCWTRKEAYIKARGEGLTLRLDQFDVSLIPGEPAALLWTSGNSRETRRWSLQELAPGSGYVAALAVEGHDWQLKCRQWL